MKIDYGRVFPFTKIPYTKHFLTERALDEEI